jgi:hypothetical protein
MDPFTDSYTKHITARERFVFSVVYPVNGVLCDGLEV